MRALFTNSGSNVGCACINGWQRFVLYFAMPTWVVEWAFECKICDELKTLEKEFVYIKDVLKCKQPRDRPKCYNSADHGPNMKSSDRRGINMKCVDKVFFERWFGEVQKQTFVHDDFLQHEVDCMDAIARSSSSRCTPYSS